MSLGAADTIFALSSGSPPAAIAVVRISGPKADHALNALTQALPEPRRARLARLSDPETGELLDNALILRFPGPNSSTGEDLAELHLHGGRSVVAAVLAALGRMEGLRPAEPGEFTRRAFENGRIDLAEAEGLSDLLSAETEAQRRAALALAGGSLSKKVEQWQQQIVGLAAKLEAALDFSDEDDVGEELPAGWRSRVDTLIQELRDVLARPPAERLREGIRVVIAGPPNVGKSSMLNALVGRRAAITSAVAGTTRDLIEAPVALAGAPFLLMDTAGLRDSSDEIESIGVEIARNSLSAADLILWLGDARECPDRLRAIVVASKADLRESPDVEADINVSAETGEGIDQLVRLMIDRGRSLLPQEGEVAANRRHRAILVECITHLDEVNGTSDLLIASEALRQARTSLDRITGRAGVEDMLDALFGTFCIGK